MLSPTNTVRLIRWVRAFISHATHHAERCFIFGLAYLPLICRHCAAARALPSGRYEAISIFRCLSPYKSVEAKTFLFQKFFTPINSRRAGTPKFHHRCIYRGLYSALMSKTPVDALFISIAGARYDYTVRELDIAGAGHCAMHSRSASRVHAAQTAHVGRRTRRRHIQAQWTRI